MVLVNYSNSQKTVAPANEDDVPIPDIEASSTDRNNCFTSNILLVNIVQDTPLTISLAVPSKK